MRWNNTITKDKRGNKTVKTEKRQETFQSFNNKEWEGKTGKQKDKQTTEENTINTNKQQG